MTAPPPNSLASSLPSSDRGSLTIISMFLLVIALSGAALIVDGGRALAARRHAANTAEAAARFAVADQSLTGGFDENLAVAVARSHAQRSGVDAGDVTVAIRTDQAGRPEVVVTVTEHPTTVFLVLGGRADMTVRATGAATFVYSI
ncbi:MAG: pilus assembly protein TadG-related protein [Actinomycetota bacterium]|jgi:Flp pilus assembly protein TadG